MLWRKKKPSSSKDHQKESTVIEEASASSEQGDGARIEGPSASSEQAEIELKGELLARRKGSTRSSRSNSEQTEWVEIKGLSRPSFSSEQTGAGIEGSSQLSWSHREEVTGVSEGGRGSQEGETDERSPTRPPSRGTQQWEGTIIEDEVIERKQTNIVVSSAVLSVVFLADGEHFIIGDTQGRIVRWRIEDGQRVGKPMVVGRACSLAISQDAKWVVAGTDSGKVAVWDAKRHEQVKQIQAHKKALKSIDIAPDRTKFATASDNNEADVYSLDGQWLWGRKDCNFRTVTFSSDSRLIAHVYEHGKDKSTYVAIHNSRDGKELGHTQINAQSVLWASDSKQLFALDVDGDIHCVDVSSRKTVSKWPIHSNKPACMFLSTNGAFIAACANSSTSFWDSSTHKQIGTVIHHPHSVHCMAISQNYDLVVAGSSDIAIWDLRNVVSTPYIEHHATISKRDLKQTNAKLRLRLAAAKQKEDVLEETTISLSADLTAERVKSTGLETAVQALRAQLADSQQKVVEALRARQQTHDEETKVFETTIQQLRNQLADAQKKVNAIAQESRVTLANHQQKAERMLWAHRQKHQCEDLYTQGHVIDAAKALSEITRSVNDDIKSDAIIMDWLSSFMDTCVAALKRIGEEASQAKKDDDALAAYAAALSLRPSSPNTFLIRWVNTMLPHGSTDEIVLRAREFGLPKFSIYRAVCDTLERAGRVSEAITYFRRMQNELAPDTDNERVQWELEFKRRSAKRLEKVADAALEAKNGSEANKEYTTILSLDPPNRMDILLKRSKTRVTINWWKDALKDADEAIELDPSSHLGYERRYTALRGLQRPAEAAMAYNTMLSKLKDCPDTRVRELRSRHAEVVTVIRRIIQATLSLMPRILIDTEMGLLNDRTQQAKAFEALPIFNELVMSMADNSDTTRIRQEVEGFYRYVMFSHRWEGGEPLLQQVGQVSVYKLQVSPTNIKLQKFCLLVRSLGFRWAWSDTCCIDKENNVVLQESLVAMFMWYRGSSLTVVYLLGVSSLDEEPDGVRRSIWNSRVWTYQEYVAAKRVIFYTEDWKPYLGLTLDNHKESAIIQREMEISQVTSEQVALLQPGLNRIREKLYLASTRETTLPEDIAYSLLGILNASIPIIYGEGTRAVGRLLEYVLTGSGDATILAWTGTANDHNSCLPVNLAVYNPLVPPHIPHMATVKLNLAVSELRSSLDMSLATMLHDELGKLPSPTVTSSRLRLPGIVSYVTNISLSGADRQKKYRATTKLFGDVDITTASDLCAMKGLCLAHPWTRPLLDQEFARGDAELDAATQALRLIARLRQPFGALLFAQVSRSEYKRVAADSLVMVQFREEVSLTELTSHIRTIEVL